MSHHPHAILYYGFNLSSGIAWEIEEASDCGDPVLSWMRTGGTTDEHEPDRYDAEADDERDADDEDNTEDDFITQAKARLVALAPARYADADPDTVLRDHYGVTLSHYAYYDDRTYYLAAHVIETDGDDDPLLINARELVQRPEAERWDDKLRAVLDVLEITPKQALPSWIQHSYIAG
ncbi:hypothetical protein ETD86_45820 [Nonomuraea turkmeniaca]|uniref:Uncharacterized protein n=1 Tax=Nonomuraea turkmeniaca TaxID=103838 RepID=A0A5S4FIL7_9ACTN|nr:hypothetical protein [Nonomuraea turkmeniaca]TMR08894.1 hypothetical protein ETD86_45820 [Nonomuraea turkmeniaca]